MNRKTVYLSILFKIRKSFKTSEKVVLATGVFDILHKEHIKFLKKAKKQGDILVVGIESDKRVRKLKGKGRPVNNQNQRAKKLSKLKFIDYLFILPQDLSNKEARENLIKKLKPDIYAVSAHTPFQKEKQRIMKKYEGKLKVIHPYNPKISTTLILNSNNLTKKNKLMQISQKRCKIKTSKQLYGI